MCILSVMSFVNNNRPIYIFDIHVKLSACHVGCGRGRFQPRVLPSIQRMKDGGVTLVIGYIQLLKVNYL